MKAYNITMALLFGLFAYFQINDPDPFLWVTIYGVVGLVSLLRIFNIFQSTMTLIILTLILLYAALHFSSFWHWLTHDNKSELFGSMIYDKPHVEGTREFLGLLMAGMALSVQFLFKSDK